MGQGLPKIPQQVIQVAEAPMTLEDAHLIILRYGQIIHHRDGFLRPPEFKLEKVKTDKQSYCIINKW